MIHIGCHLSSSAGFEKMGEVALSIGADTFQFFTRNPRGGSAKALDERDVSNLSALLAHHQFAPLLAHAPYTLNLASDTPAVREFASMVLHDDLQRLEQLPCRLYNVHPGSHTGLGVDRGIELIAAQLNEVLDDGINSLVLLETMAGKGSEIGSNFEELARIIERVERSDKIGICIDTCHVFCAGYDIINDLDGVLEQFDRIVGISRLKAVHLNDSMMPFASNKDRHAGIGEGLIGLDALVRFVTHKDLSGLPFLLETPYEPEGHALEIRRIQEMVAGC